MNKQTLSHSNNSVAAKELARKQRKWQQRRLFDRCARFGIGVGGVGVIMTIVMIFFYLAYIVIPLFFQAGLEKMADYQVPHEYGQKTLHLALEEQAQAGARFLSDGRVVFFKIDNGQVIKSIEVSLPDTAIMSSFHVADPAKAQVVYGLSDGTALVVKAGYQIQYIDDKKILIPKITYPLGETPLVIDEQGASLSQIAMQYNEEGATLVALTDDKRTLLAAFLVSESLFDDEPSFDVVLSELQSPLADIDYLLLDYEQQYLYLANQQGDLAYFDIHDKESPELVQRLSVVESDRQLTQLQFLSSGYSLIAGDSKGGIAQWFRVRDEQGHIQLQKIRTFGGNHQSISKIVPEHFRKGFAAADDSGNVGLYYATSQRTLLYDKLVDKAIAFIAISPRADRLLIQEADGGMHVWSIDNEHPEISWTALWDKVWYEGYEEPKYIWQSSSASNDFEPKLSLVPLSFGTLKAALYAMMLAVPLAILGAIYTAYFMAPKLRQVVKPTIEIMEALPTVILGFLAGLWLAPFMEENLAGIFCISVLLPIFILSVSFLWWRLPEGIRYRIPDGWHPVLLIPVVIIGVWFCLAISPLVESVLFGGNMRLWLNDELGLSFDQRNSMVVGVAMGFAVIPTIFSIAEDAIFSVPKHLTSGSLALGATTWQTLVRVVIPTASPGIFSGVMIGFGRAVGETMIVLMATGNTPIMNFNMFEGMRTLSANIAVEMPESEVYSTHYRVLFLAALVLFLFTFFFNTIAELVRHRLRRKYGSL